MGENCLGTDTMWAATLAHEIYLNHFRNFLNCLDQAFLSPV